MFSGDEDNGDRDAFVEHENEPDSQKNSQEDEEMATKKALETIKEVTEENESGDEDSKRTKKSKNLNASLSKKKKKSKSEAKSKKVLEKIEEE